MLDSPFKKKKKMLDSCFNKFELIYSLYYFLII